ncbi:MAG: Bug family tripartite tricarboxylate transporter substrate binding protein [Betaproteobacteria bacterium]
MTRFLLFLFLVFTSMVQAQSYPAKPVRIICPFPPGGGVDITARAIAAELSKGLGQPVTVENRPGAGGNVAAGELARSAPDGYTLMLTLNSLHSIAPLLYSRLPFDAAKDFAYITPLVTFSNVLVVTPSIRARSVQELIAQAKREPGKLNFGSSGNGTNIHLVGELFKAQAGIDIVHVPYKGSAPALTDLLAGNLAMMFETIPFAVSQIKAGKLRALAVTGAKRSPVLPEVPTVAESGLPGFETAAWYGIISPAGTPRDIVMKLNAEAVKGANSNDFRSRMEPLGFEIVTSSPERMAEMVRADGARWAPVVKAAGVKID